MSLMKDINTYSLLSLTATLLLFLAVFPMGYGYYQFLRVVIFSISIVFLFIKNSKFESVRVVFILISVLFNPVFIVNLMRDIWTILDVIAGLFFLRLTITLISKKE